MTIRVGASAAIAFAAAVLTSTPVLGHAQLVSSNPRSGGTLATTPATISAMFSEVLTPDGSSLVVQNAAGAQVAAGTVSGQDNTSMSANVPQLPDGQYTVLWTAVTADDKAVERGTYSFTVGAAGSTAPTASPSAATGQKTETTSGGDVVIALVLAGIVVVVVLAYLFRRNRT